MKHGFFIYCSSKSWVQTEMEKCMNVQQCSCKMCCSGKIYIKFHFFFRTVPCRNFHSSDNSDTKNCDNILIKKNIYTYIYIYIHIFLMKNILWWHFCVIQKFCNEIFLWWEEEKKSYCYKAQNVIKLKRDNFKKIKLWQNSKTQMVKNLKKSK